VIRPAGTTSERYTVDVDDCGEPGSEDTFGITTTTYSNGPSRLIGGNIQIKWSEPTPRRGQSPPLQSRVSEGKQSGTSYVRWRKG